MRLDAPRVAPIADEALTPEQREAVAPMTTRNGMVLNIFRTLVHSPEALNAFMSWGGYVLSDSNSLPPREREIAILRIGYRCRSGYEFAQHTRVGQRCGLSLNEVEAIKGDPADPRWTDAERALLVASDELHQSHFISDSTWKQLGEHFTDKQRMDLVFTVGQYTQVSMILNTFGVQLDPGQELDPDLRA
jgi:4-carboxymuconolactone decarboxylase